MAYEEISASDFLAFKERKVGGTPDNSWMLEIDVGPFERDFPKLQESRSIGRGVEFMNRRLSSQLFEETNRGNKKLLDFLRVHSYRGIQLMLNERITDVGALRQALRRADDYLLGQGPEAGWKDVEPVLQHLGFEAGWGRTIDRIRDSMGLLTDIMEAPEPGTLERFLARIPMVFSVLILSPHGYFGQANVLGLPDTGGQVVYILDQVRALEREMRQRIRESGLDIEPRILVLTRLIPENRGTTSNERLEHIVGTERASILRLPFRGANGQVIPQWISRFEVWPYLERFAADAEVEVLAELGGRPDLIVGNYSDGNLVATLMASRLKVTQ
jgi:sucrose synthase